MALAVSGCSWALVFIIKWLLIKAKIDVCSRGDVTAKPSDKILPGSAVNISCSLKPNQGCSHSSSFNRLILYKSDRRVGSGSHRSRSLSSQFTDLPLGKTEFSCRLACPNGREVPVCGVTIFVGVAPGQPQNLSCVQKGEQGTVACTWDRGGDTYLPVEYTVQLSGPKNLTLKKQCKNYYCSHLDLRISLSPESPESTFTAKVTANNSLGSSSSFPSTFTFFDIVRPLPPWDISIRFQNDSASRCSLQWRDEALVLLSRLRYRSGDSGPWTMVSVTNAKGRHDLLGLKPFTEYEFQIAAKLHLYKGSWSDWSEPLRAQTPEKEPTGMLDVWYMRQHVDHHRQQISLFWKNLSISEARGKILYYRVTLQEVPGWRAPLQNITGHTSWIWVIPRTGNWAVTVSAANSKGSSPPTRINIGNLCGAELLAPGWVSADSQGEDSVVVSWQPPRRTPSAVSQYVVEWREFQPGGDTQPPLNWLRSPPSGVSALISENIRPYVCYEIRVFTLSGDQGGCSSILGSSKDKAPQSGPHINAVTEEKGSVLISWTSSPAQEQTGCILNYRIYWKEQDPGSQPQFYEIPYRVSQNSHTLNNLQPRVTYILWMTALTAAGESSPGNEREFCLQGGASWKVSVALSVCIAVVMVTAFSMRYFRQKVFLLLLALRPQWCNRDVPDPAHSMWAKQQPLEEEWTQLPPDRLLTAPPAPEEPEPLVISEVLRQGTPAFRHRLCWPEKGQGVQGQAPPAEDAVLGSSSPRPLRVLPTERRQQGDLYRALGGRDPDTKLGSPASPPVVLPADYLPTPEGYLPTGTDEAPHTGPQGEVEPQHIFLSVFPSSSFHPLTSSCGEKLTLAQLKMGCDSLML
ncbi:interleukin-12 receptor subunit beta-2 [Nycticebus coucang]|uniref:interleukin-12 receptor subunit beta-2 n=1 Tax=Nycticebus coucang TaxID=9470 RepID=UPI00234D27FD|nr:interleukin-12 receptor subunit beta-2 [Nycticebus coucang]